MSDSDIPRFLIAPIERSFGAVGNTLTIHLEQAVWDGFDDICQREGRETDDLITEISESAGAIDLADGIADFVARYFKAAVDRDPPTRRGLSEGDEGAPVLSPPTVAALDAVGAARKQS